MFGCREITSGMRTYKEAWLDELLQESSEGLTMNSLVPLAVFLRLEQYFSDPNSEGLGWIGFGRQTMVDL